MMIDKEQKRKVLDELITNLALLMEMLRRDRGAGSSYASFFEPCLEQAKRLSAEGFTFEDLKDLSRSLGTIMHRNFLDYSPALADPATGRLEPVKGTEGYYDIQRRVSELSLELRTLGTY